MTLPEPEWLWLAAGLLLAAAEIVSPGVFLIWIGAAALLTGLATLAFDPGLPAQFVLFAASTVATVLLGRGLALRYPAISDDPLLNDRGARLIGRTVEVIEPIRGGIGRVRVGDSVWIASGPDAGAGDRVRVAGIADGRLQVEPAARGA